ncbi:MAG: Lrp/AsnC ligand binding domain-containing protein [Anaeromyxobacter sp.]|nr:Lrp/AsnC ligand binding domain-containing protein [Anaeromyxobacter sp.]MBL0276436.1 Lrp/AsnC ligand binding domain-containing protein [Anaeromyxobacter sp.]
MKAAFVLVKCELGRVQEVARAIIELDGVSEVHSITGDHDLLVKLYADDYDAFGDLITHRLQRVPGMRETTTMLAYRAFGGDAPA